jgi:aryl-alcohol dehydrogenase-like predicted oxidoreductase
MKYRTHKNLSVSEIGVGLYALAGAYGKKNVKEFKKMLQRAYELGVTFFDTAEGYGNAEQILGEVINPYRDEVCIATKVGIRQGVTPNLSAEYIKIACEQSLRRLQTEYLDLYQVHFDDPDTPVKKTVAALEDLVCEGKVHRYGIGHLPTQRAKMYCRTGNIFSILMELSAVSRYSRTTLLPLCQKYGAGGIAFSTTGRGLLTGRFQRPPVFDSSDIRHIDPLFRRENFQSALRITRKFIELGKEYDKTPVQTALAWVLSQNGIICALTGPSTIPHLEEDVGGSGWSLSSDSVRELEILFNHEDQWLKKEQLLSVREILTSKLPQDSSEAFRDLVYVLDTAMALRLAKEKEIFPLFNELFKMWKTGDTAGLKNIQKSAEHILDLVGST